jgi:hypothetical protein
MEETTNSIADFSKEQKKKFGETSLPDIEKLIEAL